MSYTISLIARGGDQVKSMLAGIRKGVQDVRAAEKSGGIGGGGGSGGGAGRGAMAMGRPGFAGRLVPLLNGQTGGGGVGQLAGLARFGGAGIAAAGVGLAVHVLAVNAERAAAAAVGAATRFRDLAEAIKSNTKAADMAANSSMTGAAGDLRSLSRFGQRGVEWALTAQQQYGPSAMGGMAALAKADLLNRGAMDRAGAAASTGLVSFGDAAKTIAANPYMAKVKDENQGVAAVLESQGYAGIKAGEVANLRRGGGAGKYLDPLQRIESAQGAIATASINRAVTTDTLGPLREDLRAIIEPEAVAREEQLKLLNQQVAIMQAGLAAEKQAYGWLFEIKEMGKLAIAPFGNEGDQRMRLDAKKAELGLGGRP